MVGESVCMMLAVSGSYALAHAGHLQIQASLRPGVRSMLRPQATNSENHQIGKPARSR
jgi:hypothetical protein